MTISRDVALTLTDTQLKIDSEFSSFSQLVVFALSNTLNYVKLQIVWSIQINKK